MAISLLFGCCQVETCVSDLTAARTYMRDMLDAVPVEQELARQIAALMPDTSYDVDHLECGSAVFQANQPARGMEYKGQKSVHQTYLDSHGPRVTNLNFYVDDIVHARNLLSAMGAAVHIEGPSTAARALSDYGPANTRPGAAERPFLFMGTRHLIGFDLEIMEPNFHRFTMQATQFPAFVEPRPVAPGRFRLDRLIVGVPDLEKTWQAIAAIFAPACRSKPFDQRANATGRSFRLALGGIEIEYCQPVGEAGPLVAFLARHGPGVASIVFGCEAPDEVAFSAGRWQRAAINHSEAVAGIDEGAFIFAASRELIGFDILLERPELLPEAAPAGAA